MKNQKIKQNQNHQNNQKNKDIIFEELYEEEDIDYVNLLDNCRNRDMIDYDSFDYINER